MLTVMDESFVATLNERLMSELGSRPVYRWIRGGELWMPISMKNDDGSQAYETVRTETGLYVEVPVSHKFMFCEMFKASVEPQVFNKAWVLCAEESCLLTVEQWKSVHPGVPYKEKTFVPACVLGKAVIQLSPTLDQTMKIIDLVKANRRRMEELKTSKDLQYVENEIVAKERKAKYDRGAAMGRERLVAGQFHVPGKKDSVSMPSVTKSAKGSVN